MKKKILKKCAGVMMALTVMTPSLALFASQVTANDGIEPEIIKVAPKNMLNVQVEDKNGNSVDEMYASLKNDKGETVASWITGSDNVESPLGYNITGEKEYSMSRNEIESLVSPFPVKEIVENINGEDYTIYDDDIDFFISGQTRTFAIKYKEAYPTELTVKANSFMAFVAPEFGEKQQENIFKYQIKNNKTGIGVESTKKLNEYAGEVITNTLDKGDKLEIFCGINGPLYKCSSLESADISDKPTEYIKQRIKLSNLCGFVDDNGYLIRNGKKFSFGTDEPDKGALICLVSGSAINFAVPDDEGYVEIYIDKETGEFGYICCWWDSDSLVAGGSIGGSRKVDTYYTKTKLVTFKGVDFPNMGTTLSNVPKGNYTLELYSDTKPYEAVNQPVAVEDSIDVQMIKIILEDKHIHDYGNAYNTDAENHWKECDCGNITEKSKHDFAWVTDNEATEGEAGSKHEECMICGYKKEAVEIPALKPTEPDTEKPTQKQPTQEQLTQEQPTQEQTTKEQEVSTASQEVSAETQKVSVQTLDKVTQNQQAPITGDNISSTLLVLLITGSIVFGGMVLLRNRVKV